MLVLNPQCELKLSYERMFSLSIFLHGHVAGRPRGGRTDGHRVPGVVWEQDMGAMPSLHWWIGIDFLAAPGRLRSSQASSWGD